MRNLIAFVWKHYFFFLFLLLETLSLYLLVTNNRFQKAGFAHSANNVTGSVLEVYSNVNEYLYLKTSNEQLAKENASLRSQTNYAYGELIKEKMMVRDSIHFNKYQYKSAKVINNSTNRRNNYLTLNIGSKQGITKDMAVISTMGIVGVVKAVSENFSSVISVLHKDLKVSSKLKKDGSFGPLWWDGEDYEYAILTDIPTHVKLAKGDTVITSAYSTIFPEGILVGKVDSYERRAGEYFYTVKVKLSTDFKKLNYVYVIGNRMKEEQEKLEQETQKND